MRSAQFAGSQPGARVVRSTGSVKFTRAKIVLAVVAATLAVCAAVRSYWVVNIGPYDWPNSMPAESNRVYSPDGFSMIVPEGWRSGARATYISACSGASDPYSTQLWVEKGISKFSQPQPLPANASFQGTDAYQQNRIVRSAKGARPFFESKIFIQRHGELFQIRVRTWRRPLPSTVPDSLRRYIETFSYSPSDGS